MVTPGNECSNERFLPTVEKGFMADLGLIGVFMRNLGCDGVLIGDRLKRKVDFL